MPIFHNPICTVQNDSHIFFMSRPDTHRHTVFSRWCCRNLGEKPVYIACLHKPLTAIVKTEKNNQQKGHLIPTRLQLISLAYPCRQCYALKFPHKKIKVRLPWCNMISQYRKMYEAM